MALRRPARLHLLCLMLILPWTLPPDLHALAPACLRCHPPHHRERGGCVSCHRGNDRAYRKGLAHHDLISGLPAGFAMVESPAREAGKRIADDLACRRCHRIGGRGNGTAGDLDRTVPSLTIARLREALENPAWYMPDFRLSPKDRERLLTYLLFSATSRPPAAGGEQPLVIHFADTLQARHDPFSRHCGGCHMTLTRKQGGLGRGRVAPNLSGLLGPFYPPTYRTGAPWTAEALGEWLRNPRAGRPEAAMPPLRLSRRDMDDLLRQMTEELEPSPPGSGGNPLP